MLFLFRVVKYYCILLIFLTLKQILKIPETAHTHTQAQFIDRIKYSRVNKEQININSLYACVLYVRRSSNKNSIFILPCICSVKINRIILLTKILKKVIFFFFRILLVIYISFFFAMKLTKQ